MNIRSIRKHWDEFLVFTRNTYPDIDVFLLTEINIHAKMEQHLNMNHYSRFSSARQVGKGGGIMVFVREKGIVSSLIITFSSAECIGCKFSYLIPMSHYLLSTGHLQKMRWCF